MRLTWMVALVLSAVACSEDPGKLAPTIGGGGSGAMGGFEDAGGSGGAPSGGGADAGDASSDAADASSDDSGDVGAG